MSVSLARTDRLPHRSWRMTRRAFREFALVPSLVVAAFVGLAVVAVLADQTQIPGLDVVQKAAASVIGKKASSAALSAIATGLLTVTSITFSVLLLAVQQTASNLSPVVFDQFVRRRINQVLLGFFVGLSLFAYLVMAAQRSSPPLVGAAAATLLTVVAMLLLLVLVYTTIDQMRPANVLRQIHRQTLLARSRQAHLRSRTLRAPRSDAGVTGSYRSETTGYVTDVGLAQLARALEGASRAEIRLHVTLGQSVAFGDLVATVHDDEREVVQSVLGQVRRAVVIDRRRDIDRDASTGVAEISNIAWTSGSTSKQSPQVAREALDALRDLAARWIDEKQGAAPPAQEPLSIVYPDHDLDRVLDAVYSLMVVAHESHQHLTARRVLDVYQQLLDRAEGDVHERLLRDVKQMPALLDQMPPSWMLDDARASLGATADAFEENRPGD